MSESELSVNPLDYIFEPELRSSVPRQIPAVVTLGRYHRRLVNRSLAWLTAGICGVILAPLSFVRDLSYNFPLLGFVYYIGLACLAVGAGITLWRILRLGRYRYIRTGLPLAAKIEEINQSPLTLGNETPSYYCFSATVEVNHPETGQPVRHVLKSAGFPADKRELYSTTLTPGMYATAIYLEGRFPDSLKLYGFMELNPDVDHIQTPDRASKKPLAVLVKVSGVFLLFAALIAGFFAVSRYWPVAFNNPWAAMAGGGSALLGAVLAVVFMFRAHRRQKKTYTSSDPAVSEAAAVAEGKADRKRRREAVFAWICWPLAAGMLTALIVLGGLFAANALLDRSEPEHKIVKINELTETTYNFILRTYQIEYEYPAGHRHEFNTTYEHINEFATNLGLIELQKGFFDWPWVRQIHALYP